MPYKGFRDNDAQIREIHATLHDDRHDPRVEVAGQVSQRWNRGIG